MRRSFAFVPPAVVCLALAASSVPDAMANESNSVPAEMAARGTMHVAARLASHATLPLHGSLRPGRARPSSYNVVEGTLPAATSGARCPPEMANIDDRFCIDRWEGSLVEVLSSGSQRDWPPFGALESCRNLRAVSRPNVIPQAYISGAQAAQVCAAAGKRLCAPVEWRKACMGPRPQTFGYGNTRVEGRCNDRGKSPMMRLFPQVGQSWGLVGMLEMNDPRLNQQEDTLAPTGSHEACTNDYGVYDMVGNLHEWTSDPNGTFQGGYYLDTHLNGDGCTYRTVAHEFAYHDYSTGFRCCADAGEP